MSARCPLYLRSDIVVTQTALCHVWTAPSWQELSSRLQHWSVQPCVRPVMRHTWPLAIMPSADQVPIKSTHLTMRWPKWVVLIAGSNQGDITWPIAHSSANQAEAIK